MTGKTKALLVIAGMVIGLAFTQVLIACGTNDAAGQEHHNASAAQYSPTPTPPPVVTVTPVPPKRAPKDLPMTGFLLVPLAGVGAALVAVGIITRRRT